MQNPPGPDRPRPSTDSRSAVHFDEESQQHHHHHHHHHSPSTSSGHLRPQDAAHETNTQQELRRRRSSIADRFSALRSAGGPNSIDNFARSLQRAAGFHEIMPVRHSFVFTDGGEQSAVRGESESETSAIAQRSQLRRQAAEHADATKPYDVFDDDDMDGHDQATPTGPSRLTSQDSGISERSPLVSHRPSRDNIFNIEPSLASPFGGSYGSTWGSLATRVNEPSMRHAGRLFRQQQLHGTTAPDKEREPLLVHAIQDDDGKIVNVIVGKSTVPHTVMNSINVLIGVGILSLPLALRYAGWVPGLIFLSFAGGVTSYTAKILAKCADVDNSIITFSDLAKVAFGRVAQHLTSVLFTIELIGASVALIVLFADSLHAIFPETAGLTIWKMVCGVVLLPLAFTPLRWLGLTSFIGVCSTVVIVLAVLSDGLIKSEQPGSLRHPAKTYAFPANWLTLPISLGLLMAPWGGHSVFPNIYRDMRHPYKYRKSVDITYIFTFILDTSMAVVGYLMFGDDVQDEVTRNIVTQSGYPKAIGFAIIVAIAIIPITKVPLNTCAIVASIEGQLGLDARTMPSSPALTGLSGFTRGVIKFTIRVLCIVVFVILSIAVPDFDRIMSLMGAVACFSICIILPCSFHLKLFAKELTPMQKTVDWLLIVFSSVLALISTAANCVPKDKLGIV